MKKNKIIFAVSLIVLFIMILSSFALAFNPSDITGEHNSNAAQSVKTIGEKILGIVQIVGTTVSIIILIILGIKYMTGSVEEKAEYKKTLMPYLIGAVFVLGATNITKWIFEASKNFF